MHCTYTRLTVLHEKPYMFCVLISTENKNGKPKDLLKSFHVLFPSHISSVFVQRNTGEYSLWLFRANFWSLRTTENDGVRFILGNNLIPSASNTLDTVEVHVFKTKLRFIRFKLIHAISLGGDYFRSVMCIPRTKSQFFSKLKVWCWNSAYFDPCCGNLWRSNNGLSELNLDKVEFVSNNASLVYVRPFHFGDNDLYWIDLLNKLDMACSIQICVASFVKFKKAGKNFVLERSWFIRQIHQQIT